MRRLTMSNAESLADAAAALYNAASELEQSIADWVCAKEEGDRLGASEAMERIDNLTDSLEVALGDLGYQKETKA